MLGLLTCFCRLPLSRFAFQFQETSGSCLEREQQPCRGNLVGLAQVAPARVFNWRLGRIFWMNCCELTMQRAAGSPTWAVLHHRTFQDTAGKCQIPLQRGEGIQS